MGEFIDKLKGKVKQIVGKTSGNRRMQAEGHYDEAKGKVKGGVEEIKHGFKQTARKEPPNPPTYSGH